MNDWGYVCDVMDNAAMGDEQSDAWERFRKRHENVYDEYSPDDYEREPPFRSIERQFQEMQKSIKGFEAERDQLKSEVAGMRKEIGRLANLSETTALLMREWKKEHD